MDVRSYFSMDIPFDLETFMSSRTEKNIDTLFDAVVENFTRRMEKMALTADPVVQQVYERQGAVYDNILIPITDGKRTYNISVNLKQASETHSKEVVKSFEKTLLLYTIDDAWKENLRELDDLKTSVQNASYEQKDPLLIYKLESYSLFKDMVLNINKKTCTTLMRGQIPLREPEAVRQAAPEKREDFSKYRTRKDEIGGGAPSSPQAAQAPQQQQHVQPIRVEQKIGRNDPCPCGSGKKYKQCHGQNL
jgi:preprotein translocase subunit SecA